MMELVLDQPDSYVSGTVGMDESFSEHLFLNEKY